MTTAYNPWRALGQYRDIWIEEQVLPAGEAARFYRDLGVIQIARGLSQVRRRTAIAHEVVHIECGDRATCSPGVNLRQERHADQAAARRLIDIGPLGDALCAASDNDWAGVAWELWVDVPTLRTRLSHLHPSEKHYLRRRLAARDNEGDEHGTQEA